MSSSQYLETLTTTVISKTMTTRWRHPPQSSPSHHHRRSSLFGNRKQHISSLPPTKWYFPNDDDEDAASEFHKENIVDRIRLLRALQRQRRESDTRSEQHLPQKAVEKSSSGTFEIQTLNNTQYSFDTIGGCQEIKTELHQIYDMMYNPDKYSKWNVRVPKGVLLHGQPGTGKTLLAKCFAGQYNLPLIATSGSEFQEKYVGTGTARVRELFEFARQHGPCIIFIDEIDALGRKRGDAGEAAQAERDSTLNQLLVEMDGIPHKKESNDQPVFVLASTNRIDVLDPALLRPGRFDKKVHIPLPSIETRRAILDIHLPQKPIQIDKDYLLHVLTNDMTGAQIEHLLNEASLYGIRHDCLPVNQTLFEKIYEMTSLGLTAEHIETLSLRQSTPSHYRVAIHEMGHVLMALLSSTHPLPRKCTIQSPSPDMVGYTIFEPFRSPQNSSTVLMTRPVLEDRICVLLGGRAAEHVLFGEDGISSGSSNDLRMATRIATEMIMTYGMGPRLMYSMTSDRSRKSVDDAVSQLIHTLYQYTRRTLETHKPLLVYLAQHLHSSIDMSLHDIHQTKLKFEDSLLLSSLDPRNNEHQDNKTHQ